MTPLPPDGGPPAHDAAGPGVAVPPDLERPDRLAGPLTGPQLVWLLLSLGPIVAAASSPSSPLRATLAVVAALAGATGAVLQPGGRPVHAWVVPLAGYLRRTRHHPAAPDTRPAAARPTAAPFAAPRLAGPGHGNPAPRPRASRRVALRRAGALATAGAALVAGLWLPPTSPGHSIPPAGGPGPAALQRRLSACRHTPGACLRALDGITAAAGGTP